MAIAGISPMTKTPETLPYAFLSPLPRHRRGGTTQRVQDVIREAIVTLALAPGDFIHKQALCKRLGVSRFPVSEALGRLADEGLVDILPQRGTRVSRIDLAACRQMVFIRRALEVEATGVIASRAHDDLFARLDNNLLEQKLAVEDTDGRRFFQHDLAFHDLLLSELAYDRVKLVVEAVRGSLDRVRFFLLRTPQRQAQSYGEHVAIVEALKKRDGPAAQRAMRLHLDNAIADIEARAAANPGIFAPEAGTVRA
jgi:DNA-binding GntR family transcriptional regulator